MKTMRSVLVAAIAGCALALGAAGARAVPLCVDIVTIGDWAAADGGCNIGDKNWDLNSTSATLLPGTQIIFAFIGDVYSMQIIGFDNSTAAGAWDLNYTISVIDPLLFHLSDMFAGADNPGGGSSLRKAVIGDAGGPFLLTVSNGVENLASEKHGLNAPSLTVHEIFTVNSNSTLLSVSDTFIQGRTLIVPEPGTLLLMAIGMLGAGWVRGRLGKRA
ncbi:MAG: PEP-CTERM sorting domain-containing protein [Burkholderiaceae bacterium]